MGSRVSTSNTVTFCPKRVKEHKNNRVGKSRIYEKIVLSTANERGFLKPCKCSS